MGLLLAVQPRCVDVTTGVNLQQRHEKFLGKIAIVSVSLNNLWAQVAKPEPQSYTYFFFAIQQIVHHALFCNQLGSQSRILIFMKISEETITSSNFRGTISSMNSCESSSQAYFCLCRFPIAHNSTASWEHLETSCMIHKSRQTVHQPYKCLDNINLALRW